MKKRLGCAARGGSWRLIRRSRHTTTPEHQNPSSWLCARARSGVAREPVGIIVIAAALADPIAWLDHPESAMGVVARPAGLEVVVPALRAEPVACPPLLKQWPPRAAAPGRAMHLGPHID